MSSLPGTHSKRRFNFQSKQPEQRSTQNGGLVREFGEGEDSFEEPSEERPWPSEELLQETEGDAEGVFEEEEGEEDEEPSEETEGDAEGLFEAG